jgi:hypothetical protein
MGHNRNKRPHEREVGLINNIVVTAFHEWIAQSLILCSCAIARGVWGRI